MFLVKMWHFLLTGQNDPETLNYPFQCAYHARNSEKRHLTCPSVSSGAKDITVCHFPKWQIAAILDLEVRITLKLPDNHSKYLSC